MFDTMTMVKVGGGLCGTFLVFLLGGWAAETVYASGGGHHGEGEHKSGYHIEVAAAGGEAEEEVPFAELLAAADPAKGERVFKKCASCHSLEDGANGTGPTLYGVVGRPVQSIDGFGYSGALAAANSDAWTPEELEHFLTKPGSYARGTSMGFNGLPKIEDRANLIKFLMGSEG